MFPPRVRSATEHYKEANMTRILSWLASCVVAATFATQPILAQEDCCHKDCCAAKAAKASSDCCDKPACCVFKVLLSVDKTKGAAPSCGKYCGEDCTAKKAVAAKAASSPCGKCCGDGCSAKKATTVPANAKSACDEKGK